MASRRMKRPQLETSVHFRTPRMSKGPQLLSYGPFSVVDGGELEGQLERHLNLAIAAYGVGDYAEAARAIVEAGVARIAGGRQDAGGCAWAGIEGLWESVVGLVV